MGTPGKTYQSTAGLIDRVYDFDARFFGMSDLEAVRTDPQQRLLLELSWQALEQSGLDYRSLVGSSTGVYVGLSSDDYADFYTRSGEPERISPLAALGCGKSIAPGRISYFYGLRGPAIQVDTSCSSALTAADMACAALRNGDIDMAFVGGANLMLTPGASIAFSAMQALSPSGVCRPFDDNADGYVRGEGGAVLILKRLSDALCEHLPIQGVIRGCAINHDGKSNGMTAPNGIAQKEVIAKALRNARITAQKVRYVECHGTSTPLGDPIELGALAEFYGKDARTWIGSVKSNIGHLEAAAGLAGLIKAVLAVNNGTVPPTLNCSSLTRRFDWSRSHLAVATESQAWPDGETTRYAGVSSFGMSGTNAHFIVSNWPEEPEPVIDGFPCLTLSGKDEASLQLQLIQMRNHVENLDESRIPALCLASNLCKSHLPVRFACSVSDKTQLLALLDKALTASVASGVSHSRSVCFVFSGQGAQYKGMGQDLYHTSAVFKEALDQVADFYASRFGFDLLDCLFAGESDFAVWEVQPALFAIQYALVQFWEQLGIVPAAVLGHSLGEYAAACCAGVLTLEQAAEMVWHRAHLIQQGTAPGCMYAVSAAHAQVSQVLGDMNVSVAAINLPDSCVIATGQAEEAVLCKALQAAGLSFKRLSVERGYHSYLMDAVLPQYAAAIAHLSFKQPHRHFYSTVTGQRESLELTNLDYWQRHIRETVQFSSAVEAVMNHGTTLFLEVGPSAQLSPMLKAIDVQDEHAIYPSLSRNFNDRLHVAQTLSQLYQSNHDINWKSAFKRPAVLESLPLYRFNRNTYFPEHGQIVSFSEEQFKRIIETAALS